MCLVYLLIILAVTVCIFCAFYFFTVSYLASIITVFEYWSISLVIYQGFTAYEVTENDSVACVEVTPPAPSSSKPAAVHETPSAGGKKNKKNRKRRANQNDDDEEPAEKLSGKDVSEENVQYSYLISCLYHSWAWASRLAIFSLGRVHNFGFKFHWG